MYKGETSLFKYNFKQILNNSLQINLKKNQTHIDDDCVDVSKNISLDPISEIP